jgi:hypothetical protein
MQQLDILYTFGGEAPTLRLGASSSSGFSIAGCPKYKEIIPVIHINLSLLLYKQSFFKVEFCELSRNPSNSLEEI